MKTLIFLLIAGGMFPAFGQNKFALAVQLAPVYTHTDAKINFLAASSTNPLLNSELMAVSNGLNYSLGISARYAFSSKWSIATGIWATHVAVMKSEYLQNGFLSTSRYQYNHPFTNFYKTPLLINYKSSAKRLSPYFSAGATFDFRGTRYIDITGNGELVPVKFGKALIVTPLVGVGAVYSLSKHMDLIVQPTIQYDLEPHPDYSYYHAYQMSLQTQLMYRF